MWIPSNVQLQSKVMDKGAFEAALGKVLEKLNDPGVAISSVDDLHKHLKNALPNKIFKSDIDKFKGDGAAGSFANELIAFSSQVKGHDILLKNAAEEVRKNSFGGVVQRFTQRLAPETIKALEELMDERVKVEDETDLHTHLKRKLPKISDDELKKLTTGGAASDFVNKWISLSSKQRAYGIQDQGVAMREYIAQEMSSDVKDKGYKVVWVNATQSDQINRAILEDKAGNRVFCSLKSDGKNVTFMPERNSQSSFKEFTVAIKE